MGKNLEFLGLMYFTVFLISVFASCSIDSNTEEIFVKYRIGDTAKLDMLVLSSDAERSCLTLKNGSQKCFSISKREDTIIFNINRCDEAIKLITELNSYFNINCNPIYPFIGERIVYLGSKAYTINSKVYIIYKLFNESLSAPQDNSVLFWSEEYGTILISLNEGEYFVKSITNINLVNLVIDDKWFSGLFPMPPAPPPPPPPKVK